MKYRLLVAIEVIDFLAAMSQTRRDLVWNCFRQIAARPWDFADYTAKDATVRDVDVNVFAGFAIRYWEDFTDRHVKILEIQNADRGAMS